MQIITYFNNFFTARYVRSRNLFAELCKLMCYFIWTNFLVNSEFQVFYLRLCRSVSLNP